MNYFILHAFTESEHGGLKVSLPGIVLLAPFNFAESNVSGIVYLTMLDLYAFPQIMDENLIFQQGGALPHYTSVVNDFLNRKLYNVRIERDGWKAWPSHSPDL